MKTHYLFGLPFVTLKINSEEIECLVDTGFNGSLMLSLEKINKLNLTPIAVTQYALADGTITQSKVYEGEIAWFGKKKKISVISSPSDFSLLGMELLSKTKTTLEPSKGVLKIEESPLPLDIHQ